MATPTIVFPDKRVMWGFKCWRQHQTDVQMSAGRRQVNPRLPPWGQWVASCDLDFLDAPSEQVVGDFIDTLRGQFVPFYWFMPALRVWKKIGVTKYGPNFTIGPGDGATTVFTLPMGNPLGTAPGATVLTTAYVNGTPTGGVSLQVGTGTFGEDKIVFGAAPANLAVIEVDVTARLRIAMHMTNDKPGTDYAVSASMLTTRHLDMEEEL